MITREELCARKKALHLSSRQIAQDSGLPPGTVQKVFSGETKEPRFNTLYLIDQVLSFYEALASLDQENAAAQPDKRKAYRKAPASDAHFLQEAPARYGVKTAARQREMPDGEKLYTIKDYDALPEDQRAELIDGHFYMMCTPTKTHQLLTMEIGILFRECVRKHPEKSCMVWIAPSGVQLDDDNLTVVEPDIFITCREDEDPVRHHGAPELVVEILSPSTRAKDMTLKVYKYGRAGVKEYWIVDPKTWQVYVYQFGEETMLGTYPFDSVIPVGISGGECSIDLHALADQLKELKMWQDVPPASEGRHP